MRYIFRSWIFYYVILLAMNGIGFGLLMSAQYKSYYINFYTNDTVLTLVGSLSSVANGGFRPFWGLAFDRFSFRQIYSTLSVLNIVLSGTISAISYNRYLYLIWVFLSLGTMGGVLSYFPM